MRTLRGGVNISWEFNRDDGRAIKKAHVGALNDHAQELAIRMVREGYREGELGLNVHSSRGGDPLEGVEYSGWWRRESPPEGGK